MSTRDVDQRPSRAGSDGDDAVAPGRGTLTSRLVPPSHQTLVFRVESAEAANALADRFGARDVNNVAAGADVAVARAASSSGSSLPGDVQHKFEASTGADLSGVRVHTGSESAEAASAVGAHAYTTGQDIHMGAGAYAPSDPFGLHLLAHEVAHTVQQGGGAASGRQNKLEVSTPGDSLEVEADRAADAMVSGAPAQIGGGPTTLDRKVMRDDKKAAPPPPSPVNPTDTPFDVAKIPPETLAKIDEVAIDSLRSMAAVAVGHAHTDYMNACDGVIATLAAEKKARQDQQQALVAMALGAAGLALGPVGAAIGAKIAGPAVQQGLIDKVSASLPKLLAADGADAQTRQGLTDAVIKKLASDRVTALMAKFTPDAAKGAVGSATSAVAGKMFQIDTKGQKEDKTIAYIEALKNAGDISSSDLQTQCGTCTDAGILLGIHSQFSQATAAMYKTDIDMKAHNFMAQVATTIGEKGNGKDGNNQIVSINAYGQDRLANVKYNSDSANYLFVSWITPDMMATAMSLNPNPQKIAAAVINGHIPEPVFEGASVGKEQFFKIDAYGKLRTIVCKSDTGFLSGATKVKFVRWVAQSEEPDAMLKSQGQIGGMATIDASKIDGGFPKPPDDPTPPPAQAPAPAAAPTP